MPGVWGGGLVGEAISGAIADIHDAGLTPREAAQLEFDAPGH